MSALRVVSLRRGVLFAATALLAACGNQSSAPPAAASSDPQTASQSQNATVAELLSGSSAPASTTPQGDSSPAPPGSQSGGDDGSSAPQAADGDVEYARVVSVAPVTGPHRVCTDQTVTERRRPQDEHQVAGTVIGAIAGGVIGHQFGGGKGKTLATVGGAVGGGVVGKEVQRNQQSRDTVTHVVKHCHMVDDSTANAPVYDVVYAYQGQNVHVRLDHDPGDRLALPIRGIVE
jgi:uncharacterized protein YcfJ